jgi:chromosomal replication initiator protein
MTAYTAPGIKGLDQVIADQFGIDPTMMRIKTRKREVVEARQFAIWYRFRCLGHTAEVAAGTYGQDHSSAIHASKTVCNLRQFDKSFRRKAEQAEAVLQAIYPKVEKKAAS